MKIKIGEINTLTVKRKTDIGYTLANEEGNEVFLHFNQANGELEIGSIIDVYILLDNKKRITASCNIPYIMVNKPGFVKVINVKKGLGIFIDNNSLKDPLISNEDLPYDYDLWPIVGDTVLCKIKVTSTNLIARLITPEEAKCIINADTKLNLFDKVDAIVIKNGEQGTNLITKEGHHIFVYYKHRRRNYRIGEEVNVTITNIALDGTYDGTLLDSKVKLMKEDSSVILDYIKENDGVMPFTTASSVEEIEVTFNMSKAAFKRALGNLYKQRIIEFKNDKTYLVEKKTS